MRGDDTWRGSVRDTAVTLARPWIERDPGENAGASLRGLGKRELAQNGAGARFELVWPGPRLDLLLRNVSLGVHLKDENTLRLHGIRTRRRRIR